MSIPELATPIRIYWDITPLPATPPDPEKIAADIIDLRILNVDITVTGDQLPSCCLAVLARLAAARIPVTLTISPQALSTETEPQLAANSPREILLQADSLDELCALFPLSSAVAGISFPLTAANQQRIPEVINFCSGQGLRRLVFPMQRLYHDSTPFHIPQHVLAETAAVLSLAPPAPDLRITVHDPFVWRAIFPQTPFPEGRCQAANTMLAIDSSGIVYPCPVMPIPLGNLAISSLKEIAKGDAKKELRARILRLPQQCTGCTEAEACKGGCRGRSERVFGTWEGIDPGCK